jgi:predicted short-subunit dehydrogenase-like oxidoreductase (DUF2520 family)
MNAKAPSRPILGFIGMGKVGTSLARLCHARGYRIAALYSRSADKAAALAQQIDAVPAATPDAVVSLADLTLLTVPDDALNTVAAALINADWDRRSVVHTSGVHNSRTLEQLQARGAETGSFHPAFPFASVQHALTGLPGATFAVEAESEHLRGWLIDIVHSLEGQVITLEPDDKPLYHAALVIASNYLVTLYAAAQTLLESVGASPAASTGALNVLMQASLHNVASYGATEALTGPLVRGDLGTVAAHLDTLCAAHPDVHDLYIQLARLTYPLLEKRGITIGNISIPKLVEDLLQQDESRHAPHDT